MAKVSVSNSVVVSAPLDKVYENFNDPIIQTEWMTAKQEIRNYTPPVAVGSSFEIVSSFMGRELTAEVEVLALDPPRSFHFRIGGMVSGEIQHTFEDVGNGVIVTIAFDGDMQGFFGSFAAPLLKIQLDSRMQKDLASFKAFIEG